MKKNVDTIYDIPLPWRAQPTITRVRIFSDSDIAECAQKAVVVCTELNENPGASITNAYELVASYIVSRMGWETKIRDGKIDVAWIEHYHYPQAQLGKDNATFDLVQLPLLNGANYVYRAGVQYPTIFGDPDWKPSTREAVETLTGQAWDDDSGVRQ